MIALTDVICCVGRQRRIVERGSVFCANHFPVPESSAPDTHFRSLAEQPTNHSLSHDDSRRCAKQTSLLLKPFLSAVSHVAAGWQYGQGLMLAGLRYAYVKCR